MKVAIEVKNREEGNILRTALADPTVRALALVMGTLLSLPSDLARRRVLAMVLDRLDEAAEKGQDAAKKGRWPKRRSATRGD